MDFTIASAEDYFVLQHTTGEVGQVAGHSAATTKRNSADDDKFAPV